MTVTLSTLLFCSFVLGAAVAGYELKFVTFVHRHGDRSPVGTYPTDPYGNESLWNNGWGELTNTGKQSAFNLGKWLRQRYNGFLPEIYDKNDYEVRSTAVRRALMSGYLVLAGLYEPVGNDVWNSDINWQPIPVYADSEGTDEVLAASKPCPRHSQLMAEFMVSSEFSNKIADMLPRLREIAEFAGLGNEQSLAGLYATVQVHDALLVQDLSGFELPEWTKPYYPDFMNNVSTMFLSLPTMNRELQRLRCGSLVKDIIHNFDLKAAGSMKQKVWHYSAHDITIVGLRDCLNLQVGDRPPYSSALILELLQKGSEYFVQILYKAGDSLSVLTMPGCEEFCPLAKFKELVEPIVPVNREAECRVTIA